MLVCRFSCTFPDSRDLNRVLSALEDGFIVIRKPSERFKAEINGCHVSIEVSHLSGSKTGSILSSRLVGLWSDRLSFDDWLAALRRTYSEFGESAATLYAQTRKQRKSIHWHVDIDAELKKCKDSQLG